MKSHTLIALSEFDAMFDDAMSHRPFVARRHFLPYTHSHGGTTSSSDGGSGGTDDAEQEDPSGWRGGTTGPGAGGPSVGDGGKDDAEQEDPSGWRGGTTGPGAGGPSAGGSGGSSGSGSDGGPSDTVDDYDVLGGPSDTVDVVVVRGSSSGGKGNPKGDDASPRDEQVDVIVDGDEHHPQDTAVTPTEESDDEKKRRPPGTHILADGSLLVVTIDRNGNRQERLYPADSRYKEGYDTGRSILTVTRPDGSTATHYTAGGEFISERKYNNLTPPVRVFEDIIQAGIGKADAGASNWAERADRYRELQIQFAADERTADFLLLDQESGEPVLVSDWLNNQIEVYEGRHQEHQSRQATREAISAEVSAAVQNALASDSLTSVTLSDGTTVSGDSNGNVSVSDDETSVSYRPDDSTSRILVWDDDDGGYKEVRSNRDRLLAQGAFLKGHVMPQVLEDGTTMSSHDMSGDGWADTIKVTRPNDSVEHHRDTDGDGAPDQVTVQDDNGLAAYTLEEWAEEQTRRREYQGVDEGAVTAENADAAWAMHQAAVDKAVTVLREGGTADELTAAAAEIDQIASQWQGSGVTADDGRLMADGLLDLSRTLSDYAATSREYANQQAAFVELQADIQQVEDGKARIQTVLSKWEADPRGADPMLQVPGELLYGEEVGDYSGPPSEISAVEWLSEAVAKDSAWRERNQSSPEYNRLLIEQEVGASDPLLGTPVGLDEMAAARTRAHLFSAAGELGIEYSPGDDLERLRQQVVARLEANIQHVPEFRELQYRVADANGSNDRWVSAAEFYELSRSSPIVDYADIFGRTIPPETIVLLESKIRGVPNPEYRGDPEQAAQLATAAGYFGRMSGQAGGVTQYVFGVDPKQTEYEMARQTPAFSDFSPERQKELLDKYRNPLRNPYTRSALMVQAAVPTLFVGGGLAAQGALSLPFVAADLGGTAIDKGGLRHITQGDLLRALAWEAIPFAPEAAQLGRHGLVHGYRSFVKGQDLLSPEVWKTVRLQQELGEAVAQHLDQITIDRLNAQLRAQYHTSYGSEGGLLPPGAAATPYAVNQDIVHQVLKASAENPERVIAITLPDGRTLEYSPSRMSGLSAPGNPTYFAATPDIGFAREGHYTTMPLPLGKIDTTPVETAQFFSKDPLGQFTESSAFGVSSSQADNARSGFIGGLRDVGHRLQTGLVGTPRKGGVIAIQEWDPVTGAVNLSLSGKTYLPSGTRTYVTEWEKVRDIYRPTIAPYSYGMGMPQRRADALLPIYDQKVMLSDLQFDPADIRQVNWQILKDRLGGRFLPETLQREMDVRQPGLRVLDDPPVNASTVDYTPGDLSGTLLGEGEEYSNIARLHLERKALRERGVPDELLPTRPSQYFDPRTGLYRYPDGTVSLVPKHESTGHIDRQSKGTIDEAPSFGNVSKFDQEAGLYRNPSESPSLLWGREDMQGLDTGSLHRDIRDGTPSHRPTDSADGSGARQLATEYLDHHGVGHTRDTRGDLDGYELEVRGDVGDRMDGSHLDAGRLAPVRLDGVDSPTGRTLGPEDWRRAEEVSQALEFRTPDLRTPNLRTLELRTPDLRTPDLRTPDLRTPDLRTPDLRTPDLRTPDLRTPDLRTPDLRTPDLRTPDPHRRDVDLPDPDAIPETVIQTEEGLYPRVVAHDEMIRVYQDLDTGEIVSEPLAPPTEPVIVEVDDTPPPVGTRFAGHRRITPRGSFVFTKPVGRRRTKASPVRHPYLRRGELRGR